MVASLLQNRIELKGKFTGMELKNIKIGKQFIFGNVIFTRISDEFTNDGELFIGCRLSSSATVYIVDNAWVIKL